MKNWFLLLILLITFFSISAAESKPRPIAVTLYPGLDFSYNSIAIQSGEEKTINALNLIVSRLALEVEIFDYLSLEVLAGYHSIFAREPLDFAKLPLPLRWDRNAFSGLLLGLAFSSEPLSVDDFVLHLRGEFDISLTPEKDWEIMAPLVNGLFREESSFSLLTLDATVQYQGFTGITVFAGSRLNLLHGKFTTSEIIADVQSTQEIPFKQKTLAGPLAGARIEIGDNLELTIQASLLARSELSLSFFYTF